MILPDDQKSHERAARIIKAGGAIAFRTDTFYGLGVDPFNQGALSRLNELKGREGTPILVIISNRIHAERLIDTSSPLFGVMSERHWPGPLTLVSAARPGIPAELTGGSATVGVRLPDDDEVVALVDAVGGVLTATSANSTGKPPARTASDVEKYFHDRLDLIIDGGECGAERPSTVLNLDSEPPFLIREGAISRREIASSLKTLGIDLR
jgi:L-threonylcarbamoyladenylate synthase